MKPKIGLKTWNVFYNKPDRIEFDVYELTFNDKNAGFSMDKIKGLKEALKEKELSMHSQTKRVFSYSKDKDLTDMELDVLRAEILFCKKTGIKELIVHLKQKKLDKKEEETFREIIKFAKKHNVKLLYESNQNFFAETCLDFFDKFPEIKYNLDLGHLNVSVGNKTLGMSLDDFIEKVKDKIVYIHAHNNNGKEDEHTGLDNGTLDWKHVLDMLNLTRVKKIIIEVKRGSQIKKSKELLEAYLNSH